MKKILIPLVLLASLTVAAPHMALANDGGSCDSTIYQGNSIVFSAEDAPGGSNAATYELDMSGPSNMTVTQRQNYGGGTQPPTYGIMATFPFNKPGSYTITARIYDINYPVGYQQGGASGAVPLQINAGTYDNPQAQKAWVADQNANPPTCTITVQPTPKPDLVPGTGQTIYGTVGQNVAIPASVTNSGNADASGFTVWFNSNGQNPTVSVGGLGAGASQDVSTTLQSSGWGAGTYSYQYCVDQYGQVDESSEDNNCTSGSIILNNPPSPDVAITDIWQSGTAIAGQPVTLWAYEQNNGNADSGNFTVQFFSSDGSVNAYSGNVYLTSSGGAANTSISYTFPSAGTYYLKACASVANDSNGANNCSADWIPVTVYPVPTASLSLSPNSVPYGGSATLSWYCGNADSCGGTNFSTNGQVSGSVTVSATQTTTYSLWSNGPGGNTPAYQTLTVGPPYPDLTAGTGGPLTVVSKANFSLGGTVYNIGDTGTPSSFNNLVQICDRNDGTCPNYYQGMSSGMSALANGNSQGTSFTAHIDAPGTYYYRLCADLDTSGNGTIAESNERNNCGVWQSITVLAPDLTVGGINTTYGVLGQSVSVSGTAINNGNASTGGFNSMFVTNWNGSSWQTITSANWTSNLGPGGSASIGGTFPANAFSHRGTYQYAYCAGIDSSWNWSLNNESNTNNNCISGGSLVIQAPDLTAGGVSLSGTAIAGQPTGFNATAYNNGDYGSNAFPVMFQVQNSSGQDVAYVTSGYVGGLAPGGSTGASASTVLSSAGTYNVRACANRNSSWGLVVTNDTDTTNDCGGWTSFTLYPVPTASISLSPSSVAYGGSTTVTWSCASGATSCAGTNFNTNGAMSGSVTVSATQTTTYTVWANGPGGTTSAAQTLSVGPPYPDLTASITSGWITATMNTSFTMNGTVSNIGNAATPGSFPNMVQICDSNCATYNQRYSASTAALANGQSRAISFTASIPTAGSYYFRICADVDSNWNGVVDEGSVPSEDNNCTNWQNLTVAAPNLTPGALTPTSAVAGSPVTFSSDITNSGNSDAPSFPVRFQIQENGDVFTSTYSGSALPAGWLRTMSGSYTFASAGTYHVQACANENAAGTMIVQESNYRDNCTAWTAVTVSPQPKPDLIPGSAPTITITRGQTATVTGSVTNSGNLGATSFPTMFATNLNQAQNGWNTMQAGPTVSSLAVNGTTNITSTFPATTFPTAGTYTYTYCVNTDTSWSHPLDEGTATGNDCAWPYGSIIVNDPTYPDLIVTSAPNVSAQVGQVQNITLSGTVKNQGTADAGSFHNLMATNQTQNGWSDSTDATTISSLAQGQSATVSGSFPPGTFTSPGSYVYEICTNMNRSNGWAADLDEGTSANKGNNCTTGVITVSPPPPPPSCSGTPTLSLTSNPSRVVKNGSATLSWRVTNTLNACTVKNSSGATLATIPAGQCSDVATSSMSTGPLTKQTVYSLNCSNAGTAYATTTVVNVVPKYGEF